MKRSAEQKNRPINASRFTRFVYPAFRLILHEPRKKTLIYFKNTQYEGQSKISESCFISDKLLLIRVIFVQTYKFKTLTNIIVHSPIIQCICEIVAKQRKVIPSAFAMTLPVLKLV